MEGIIVDTQRLDRINKGTNFLNLEIKTGKRFFVKVFLKTLQDLKEKTEKVEVETNLPIRNSYYGDYPIEDFFKDLKEFVKCPLAKIRIPEKSQIGSYELRNLEDNLRDEAIRFEDIDFEVGELAKKKLKSNFVLEVQEILTLQNDKLDVQAKVNAYIRLREKITALKNLLCRESGYSYSYREKKDDTLKMPLTAEEYNEKLKEVEKELRVLEKEFNLRETDLDYIEIKEQKCFEEWFKEHEEELRENFEMNDDEETTFDEYAEMCYNEFEEE